MKNSQSIVRVTNSSKHDEKLCKLVGNIPLSSFVQLLFVADLEANARAARTSQVTEAIEDSLENQPELFHFKSKGILIAAGKVEALQRDRYRLYFNNPKLEGIIDGGHNSLAIGRFAINCIMSHVHGEDEAQGLLKGAKSWDALKEVLSQHEDDIRDNLDQLPEAYVPFEVIYPAGDDMDSLAYFEDQILIINAARNNNAQLKDETKANHKGLYDELKANIDEEIAADVEWKSGEGGRIKSRELVALSLIPLSLLDLPSAQSVRENPTVIFSSKAQCVKIYNDIMDADGVVDKVQGDIVKVVDPKVKSALRLMRDIPRLYDLIYKLFPSAYSHGFGKMSGVRTLADAERRKQNPKKYLARAPRSRFYQQEVSHDYGEGFIFPLVVALRELMEFDGDGLLGWKTDPDAFVAKNMSAVGATYKDMISGQNYDPARVGKTRGAYNLAAGAFRHQFDADELAKLRAQLASS